MRLTIAALASILTLAVALTAFADDGPALQGYTAGGSQVEGLRPTAIGLPDIGQHGTGGPGEMVPALRDYHDSGRYMKDVAVVAARAKDLLAERLRATQRGAATRRACGARYRRVRRAAGRPALYRRTRVCRTVAVEGAAQPIQGKPAIVLDIDETSLSNYASLEAGGFASAGSALALSTVAAAAPAIAPVLSLFRYARDNGVATFFITGRPSLANVQTEANLRAAGYTGYTKLFNKPGDKGTLAFKAGQRAALEREGYAIVANVGDQDSDLAGGHADRAFKVPNPFYFISE